MKKNLIILASAFIIVSIVSCSKGINDLSEKNNSEYTLSAGDSEKGAGSSFNAARKLELWFPFNGNINDASGKPVNAVITTSGADIYTEDRFGTPNGAIKFDGSYGINLTNVRASTNISVSAWVKYESANTNFYFFYGPLSLGQFTDKFSGAIITTSTAGVSSGSLDAGWHHLAATYDGSSIKFYVDGNFVGQTLHQGSLSVGGYTFWLSSAGPGFWNGSMDDLRFYNRTLKANEVQSLYNL